MFKYTQLFSALIILLTIVEISCSNPNQIKKVSKIEISDITTNELLQASPISLNPPDQHQKLVSYDNSANAFYKDVNPAIMLFNQCLGYIYMILMATSGYLIVKEPLNTKCSTGLSKDFLLIHFTGYFLLMFNDAYGFFGNSAYKNQVHISDVILSFLYTLFMVAGFVETRLIPCDPVNRLRNLVKFMSIASI